MTKSTVPLEEVRYYPVRMVDGTPVGAVYTGGWKVGNQPDGKNYLLDCRQAYPVCLRCGRASIDRVDGCRCSTNKS
jgi:hypothetical protein